ncbi:MAG: hypothetical protein II297_05985 [Clostridia bacterium]|nr:hypothetical protein [Clostridia bacterium]
MRGAFEKAPLHPENFQKEENGSRIVLLDLAKRWLNTIVFESSPTAVSPTTIKHPLFLWQLKAQRKSLAKRNAAKEFRRCDGEKACAAFTRASF